MIIDCHCHAGPGNLLTAPWNTDAPLRDYLRRCKRAGIERTVIFPAFQTDYAEGNRRVASYARRFPNRFIGFAMVHAGRDAGHVHEMVREMVVQNGFRGIKIHGAEHMPTREVCETARAFGVPVLVDVASKAHVVDMFAPAYQDVNFIIAHLGSFEDDWRAHERVVEQLRRYPNVYADTSGVRRFDYLARAVREAGARKILFGSDGPWLHPGLELHKIRLLRLPPGDQALILGGNIRRLLRLDQPVSRRTRRLQANRGAPRLTSFGRRPRVRPVRGSGRPVPFGFEVGRLRRTRDRGGTGAA